LLNLEASGLLFGLLLHLSWTALLSCPVQILFAIIAGQSLITKSFPFYCIFPCSCRKDGKLHDQTVSVEYKKEYGSDKLEINLWNHQSGENIVTKDGVLATAEL
jgi:hypothetical protein